MSKGDGARNEKLSLSQRSQMSGTNPRENRLLAKVLKKGFPRSSRE
jgi:hypothetical protein